MICYRDKTFCPFDKCKKFQTCQDAYTDAVKSAAVEWWGNKDAPVSLCGEKPKCFKSEAASCRKGKGK